MKTLRLIIVLACLALLAGAAQGQVASMHVAEGEAFGNAPDYVVSSISNPAVAGVDGWSFNCNTVYLGDTVAAAYGTYGIATPDVLAQEIVTDIYTQNSWEGFFGMSDDGVCNSAICTRNADGQTGLDSAWYLDSVVAIEEEPYPHEAGWFWSFASRPDATRDGVPYFVGGITDTQGGSTQNRGLFYGFGNTPVILGGMLIPGLPDPVVTGSAAVSFDYRYSAYGTHFIAEIATDTGSSTNDNSMIMDGALLMVDGTAVSEGSPLPESAGGLPGENWDNFDYCGITEGGQWLLTGDTDGDSAMDEFLMVDGAIVLREGDMIDGMILAGSIEGGYLNEQGDWAVIWDVDIDLDTNVECLILNGEIVLMEGMPVDADGDGEIDEGTMVNNFTGISALVVADRDEQGRAKAYFTADCEVPGGLAMAGDQSLPRDEALGLDEPYVDEPGTRVEIELGLVLVPEGMVAIDEPNLPGDEAPTLAIALEQNYPNPFNPQTTIQYHLQLPGDVRISIFDVQGRLVRTLVEGTSAAGTGSVVWNGLDQQGQTAPAGTYVYRLETGERVLSRTMVLVK